MGIFSIYYMIIVLIADIIFIYCGMLTLRNQEKDTLHKVSKYMKIAMLIAFISFIFGSVI
jgi:geranylgeranylglycerol-phosphate geranylgeranyltransferase